jgi:hypothetical protein
MDACDYDRECIGVMIEQKIPDLSNPDVQYNVAGPRSCMLVYANTRPGTNKRSVVRANIASVEIPQWTGGESTLGSAGACFSHGGQQPLARCLHSSTYLSVLTHLLMVPLAWQLLDPDLFGRHLLPGPCLQCVVRCQMTSSTASGPPAVLASPLVGSARHSVTAVQRSVTHVTAAPSLSALRKPTALWSGESAHWSQSHLLIQQQPQSLQCRVFCLCLLHRLSKLNATCVCCLCRGPFNPPECTLAIPAQPPAISCPTPLT